MQHRIMPLLAAGAMVLSTAPAHADLGDQLAKLLADDGAEEDRFGISVAINGATTIVGTPRTMTTARTPARRTGSAGGDERRRG